MKETLLPYFIFSNATSIACVVGAIILAIRGTEGWGFFLLIALLTSSTMSFDNLIQ